VQNNSIKLPVQKKIKKEKKRKKERRKDVTANMKNTAKRRG
jgi:hypothetical protein